MSKNNKFHEENNALMANGQKASQKEKESFATFIYNKREGTCLGRTAKSWVQITIFYIIYYLLLGAFWLGCLSIFLKTIDYELPRYYGKGTIIGANPGVGYQPWLKEDPESTLIKFNIRDNSTYSHYVEALNKYLERYSNTSNTRICSGSQTNSDIFEEGKVKEGHKDSCRFNLDVFKTSGCSKENGYGFKEGKPCVILSLNRLIGWTPTELQGAIPKEIAGRYKKSSIAFSCDGTYEPDKEYIGRVEYIPEAGIDGRFYPYAVMPNYHQPIAMVKFHNLPKNRIVLVECRAYAGNIEQDIETRQGLVHFELLLEDQPVIPSPETNGS